MIIERMIDFDDRFEFPVELIHEIEPKHKLLTASQLFDIFIKDSMTRERILQ